MWGWGWGREVLGANVCVHVCDCREAVERGPGVVVIAGRPWKRCWVNAFVQLQGD